MRTYQRFYNLPSYSNVDCNQAFDPQRLEVEHVSSDAAVKCQSSLKILARFELTLAIFMLLLEAIILIIINQYEHGPQVSTPCGLGTGAWIGVMGIVNASLGLGALRSPNGSKCLLVSHFILSVMSAVADGVLIMFTAICLIMLPWYMRSRYDYSPLGERVLVNEPDETVMVTQALIGVESLMLLTALTHRKCKDH